MRHYLPKRCKKKEVKFFRKGDAGFVVLLAVALVAFLLAGGIASFYNANYGTQGNLLTPIPQYGAHNTNQLHTLNFISVTPTFMPITTIPPTVPLTQSPLPTGQTALCSGKIVILEKILAGFSPAQGQTVNATGQVKVWVGDENPPCVGTGEVANPSSGIITTVGNRTEKASDGYLWEPALYLNTTGFAGNGGTPHFPTAIRGTYNNGTKSGFDCSDTSHKLNGPAIDPIPANSPTIDDKTFQDEYIWDVSSLGLPAGTYQGEFVIHDGDIDLGAGCVNITIL